MSTECCTRCGILFQYAGVGGKYCKICKEADAEDFNIVREYIYAHGSATMMEIVVATGVQEKYVKKYLREGRLEIPNDSPIFIKCEMCGCDIRSGRYCPDCGMKLSKDMKGLFIAIGDKPKDMKGSMRFLNKSNKKK